MTRLLKVDEAAKLLGLQPATVRRMIREQRLPVVRPTGARAVRVREEDVEALIRIGYRPAGRDAR
jgi:excisionase family DNA binding protein